MSGSTLFSPSPERAVVGWNPFLSSCGHWYRRFERCKLFAPPPPLQNIKHNIWGVKLKFNRLTTMYKKKDNGIPFFLVWGTANSHHKACQQKGRQFKLRNSFPKTNNCSYIGFEVLYLTTSRNQPAAQGCQRWRPCTHWRLGSDCPGSRPPQFLLCRALLQTLHPLHQPQCSLSLTARTPTDQSIQCKKHENACCSYNCKILTR